MRKPDILVFPLACGLSAAALATGCGGEDDRPDAPKPAGRTEAKPRADAEPRSEGKRPLTVPEYRKRANAMCARAKRDARLIPAPKSPEQIGAYLEASLRLARKYDKEEERALEPPPNRFKRVHERVERLDARTLAVLERAVRKIKASADPQATAQVELRGLALIADEGIALARKLGLRECAAIGQPPQGRGA